MVTKTNDGYMLLLDALFFDNKKIGDIADKGADWGGDDTEYTKLFAAQKRTAPVKKIKKKDATNLLSFSMIQLVAQNCADLMGGSVEGEKWNAPSESVQKEGPVKILCGTGQTIEICRASLDGAVRGNIGGDTALAIDTKLEVLTPTGGGSPYSIYPTTPFIESDVAEISFKKSGESKIINIAASGPFSAGTPPEGFTVDVEDGRIYVTAAANTGSTEKTGSLVFTLAADATKTVEVNLSQAGA